MIRALLATTIALVATWHSDTLVRAHVAETHDRQPPSSTKAHRFPTSFDLTRLAVMDAQPLISLDRFTSSATALRQPSPVPTPPDLTLEAAPAPVPRPLRVIVSRPLPRPAMPEQILEGASIPLPPASLRNASDLSCIAVAIYHEARDQEDFGQRAVASVILQRVAVPHRWGGTACDNVVPTQFSFLTSRYDYPPIDDMKAWEKAVRFAAHALLEGPMPELKGADHYHTTAVSPPWAPRMARVRLIDDHVFYVDPRSSLSL
ncbi:MULTISPECIES: cell wall hydrolase [unclassified Paracoccus (in: a-proteobacteria)]|uniref:cell wall hydrolase n=1 Tax=unclassified Paracoccus (in: a-proteobacteria) TaxID=2688777 RepID=UPI001601BD2A|nr:MULTISPECIES: cell wall hydrolase [unclassified Paracoccus (in: a-proteobacteria)]MBB1493337.1 cell wall hydrolase [Paracoccus sp. MC1854]MBB1499455.1 cell wall hydrolase [Paracoccus sp. MC1862]QQO45112.1 cell wall hydrolase [Paracoccus sp. MC1862]